jgi:hypothetical protein
MFAYEHVFKKIKINSEISTNEKTVSHEYKNIY